jgi:hypothetical protein
MIKTMCSKGGTSGAGVGVALGIGVAVEVGTTVWIEVADSAGWTTTRMGVGGSVVHEKRIPVKTKIRINRCITSFRREKNSSGY